MNYIEEEQYKNILNSMPICCVDIILYNENNELLLVKRNKSPAKNHLWFVGGRLLKNETLRECAKRKVKEEVGLEINDEKLKYIHTDETIFKDGPFENTTTHSINICFSAKIPPKNEIVLDKFHNGFEFVTKIPKKSHKYLINCYDKFKNELIL